MKWNIFIYCLLAMLLYSLPSFAIPHEDKIMHTTITYALITTSYPLCKRYWTELSNGECLAFSYGGAILAGMTKEFVMDSEPDPWDFLANGVGVGLSIPIVIMDFK